MPKKKKKKESLKERRRRAALKRERTLEAERIRRERKPKKRHKGWPRSKVFGALFLISLCLISYGIWYTMQPSSHSNNEPPPSNSELPPLFTLTDPDFGEFRGKVVVLDLFATWCKPCLQEIPHLAQINEKYDSSDVVVISIGSSGDSVTALRQFKKKYDMIWRVARDTVGLFDKHDVRYIPTLIILNQNGAVYYRNEGLTDASTLSNKIDSLLVH